ncbi:hypothetical protein J4731_15545 [Providencia rettgeri]|nr:hypothetical protein [Providencia rettgeri]
MAILGVAYLSPKPQPNFITVITLRARQKIAEAAGTLALSVGLAAYGATEAWWRPPLQHLRGN